MSSILISFHFDVPKCIVEEIFEEQKIVPFKERSPHKPMVYHELGGVVSRYLVEAPNGMVAEIQENFMNLSEVRSVYAFIEEGGVKRTYRRKSLKER
jgi:hypothetical protein